jgi:tRNA A37 threonylcarbamoyladenosine modification protein TsaB
VPSSLALALSAKQAEPRADFILCSIKSRGDAYYLAAFDTSAATSSGVGQVREDQLVDAPPAWLEDEWGGDSTAAVWAGAGSQPTWWPERMAMPWLAQVFPRASDCMAWVIQQHEAGASQPAEHALPRYIVGDSPWKKSAAG